MAGRCPAREWLEARPLPYLHGADRETLDRAAERVDDGLFDDREELTCR